MEIDLCSLKKRQTKTKIKDTEELREILNGDHYVLVIEIQKKRLKKLTNKNNERMKNKFKKLFDTQVKKNINFRVFYRIFFFSIFFREKILFFTFNSLEFLNQHFLHNILSLIMFRNQKSIAKWF